MLRDITLGQYYQAESVIHRMDPRVKLTATVCYIISLFVVDNAAGYIIAGLFLAMIIKLSKVPVKFMVRGMKAILFLLIIAVIFNLFLTPGEAVLSFWKLKITREGIRLACFMAIRLVFLIMGSSVMTLTTTPNNLTDGMEKLLGPLKRLRVPVHEIAMMMSIAQIARGADFESGNLIKKAKSLVPLLVPLFISAFRRANDLAMAMEARCYRGGEHRTKMKPLIYQKRDRIAYAVVAVYLVLCIIFGRILF